MGLQVALVDDPQPQLVAQTGKGGVRRIVAGAHRVDVVLLHQQQIAAHRLGAEGPPVARMELVAVDTAQQDPAPVDLQQSVLDSDRTEADAQRDPFAGGAEFRVVEVRLLGGPRAHRYGHALARGDLDAERRHADPARRFAVHPQRAVTGDVIESCVDEVVHDRALGAPFDRDVPEDSRQPPLVLVLQIAARRPLVDAYGQHIAPGPQQMPDLELVRQSAALEVPQLLPVEPHPRTGLHPAEMQYRGPLAPAFRQIEELPVIAGRVLVGHPRRVDGEGVGGIGVRGRPVRRRSLRPAPPRAVTLVLGLRGGASAERPMAGHPDVLPRRIVEIGPGERRVRGRGGRRQPEPPGAVQREPRGIRPRVPGARRQGPAPRRTVLVVRRRRRAVRAVLILWCAARSAGFLWRPLVRQVLWRGACIAGHWSSCCGATAWRGGFGSANHDRARTAAGCGGWTEGGSRPGRARGGEPAAGGPPGRTVSGPPRPRTGSARPDRNRRPVPTDGATDRRPAATAARLPRTSTPPRHADARKE